MKLYNYLQKTIENFIPIREGFVGMYVCGPTVYGDPHLGHARSALTFDILYRYLKYKKYSVRYVRNITDVGHLEYEETDSGEDKVEQMARMQHKPPMEIAHTYTLRYRKAMEQLNMLPPSIEPIASGHIMEQQSYIRALQKKGWAYEVNGNVYFDVKKFAEKHSIYGALSGKKIEDLLSGSRMLKQQDEKKNNVDFALWKTVDEKQMMFWNSEWNDRGVPGWHTECCAMSEKYLGLPFDIHGGGLDLQFPHHEAEIAQAYALHNTYPAHYWMYNNMITIDKKKMSKSAGNFITLDMFFDGSHERLSRAYNPETIRFFLLRSHYRSLLDISDEALSGSSKGLKKLRTAFDKAKHIVEKQTIPLNEKKSSLSIEGNNAQSLYNTLTSHMDSDMDTPAVIAELFMSIDHIMGISLHNIHAEDISYASVFYVFYAEILGLGIDSTSNIPEKTNNENTPLETLVECIVALRTKAKNEKNFVLSDDIRDALSHCNITLNDNTDGTTTWEQGS